ncbi:hypothetical protein KY362_00140 [Candidatus Woesearchaeota archaeon]|nr:hypothetical protein [Candidatus Woesearchaeota archaeon]
MEIKFPCGTRGRPEFCPDLCQYGKFCKVKEKKLAADAVKAHDLVEEKEDTPEEEFKIEVY